MTATQAIKKAECKHCFKKFRARSVQHKYCSDRCKTRASGIKAKKPTGLGLLISEAMTIRFRQALVAAELSVVDVALKMNLPVGLIRHFDNGPCTLEGHSGLLLCEVADSIGCSSAWLATGGSSPRAERMLGTLRAAVRGDTDAAKQLFKALELLP